MDVKFKVIDEGNIEREATLLTTIEVDNKNYAIYSIKRSEDSVNIFVSLLVVDENGNQMLKDIESVSEKEKIESIVKDIIKLPL